jgi:hypothetical protein
MSEGGFRQYRPRNASDVVWAKQMDKDFLIDTPKGRVDQRKAGAVAPQDLINRAEGKAGDYVIRDRDTGRLMAVAREAFEALLVPVDVSQLPLEPADVRRDAAR